MVIYTRHVLLPWDLNYSKTCVPAESQKCSDKLFSTSLKYSNRTHTCIKHNTTWLHLTPRSGCITCIAYGLYYLPGIFLMSLLIGVLQPSTQFLRVLRHCLQFTKCLAISLQVQINCSNVHIITFKKLESRYST